MTCSVHPVLLRLTLNRYPYLLKLNPNQSHKLQIRKIDESLNQHCKQTSQSTKISYRLHHLDCFGIELVFFAILIIPGMNPLIRVKLSETGKNKLFQETFIMNQVSFLLVYLEYKRIKSCLFSIT